MNDLKQMLQAASEDHLLADGMLYRMALARIEQLEAAISELQCDESYCGIHGKCPQCKAKTLLENKDE